MTTSYGLLPTKVTDIGTFMVAATLKFLYCRYLKNTQVLLNNFCSKWNTEKHGNQIKYTLALQFNAAKRPSDASEMWHNLDFCRRKIVC
jgi:hypothetical protein